MKLQGKIGIVVVALTAALTTACRKEPPPPPKATPSAPSAARAVAATQPSSTAAPAPPTSTPPPAEATSPVQQVVDRWNRATNEGDGKALAELYAERVGLYGRQLTREKAVAAKLEALRKSPGFSQTISELTWRQRLNVDQEASFLKTSGASGNISKVRGYLLLHHDGDAWRIFDEGDSASRRNSRVAGQDRHFRCDCQEEFAANPDGPEAPPVALPPVGPVKVVSEAEPPPGAPKEIEYAGLYEERFSMSNDVPLFVTVTNLSTNGDGRWFFFDLPGESGTKRRVLDCSHGGFWYYDAAPGTPDPGYPKRAGMTSTEAVSRDEKGIHYEKILYAPDGIESHVDCTIDPQYEAYFMPIVRRAGDTLRADPGGQYNRTPFLKRAQPSEL